MAEGQSGAPGLHAQVREPWAVLDARGASRPNHRFRRGSCGCRQVRTQQVYGDASVLVACDADLYNETELQALAGREVPAPQTCRTAALLAALYHRFGSDLIAKLSGNFALVLWDQRNRRMLAAVDGFGVNRLVYFQNGQVLAVASRIDALLQTGEVAAEVNPQGYRQLHELRRESRAGNGF